MGLVEKLEVKALVSGLLQERHDRLAVVLGLHGEVLKRLQLDQDQIAPFVPTFERGFFE